PADGDAFLISRMKRAPSCAILSARLRWVGRARARSVSSETPSNRRLSSSFFAAAIRPSTPSATACLDESMEQVQRLTRRHRVERHGDTSAKIWSDARGHQQGAGIERDDRGIRFARLAFEDSREARRIFPRRSADDALDRKPPQSRLLGRDLDLLELVVVEQDRLGEPMERHLVEPRA